MNKENELEMWRNMLFDLSCIHKDCRSQNYTAFFNEVESRCSELEEEINYYIPWE